MKKLLRFDWATKYLLKHRSHFEILEGFLTELIKDNIRIKGVLGSTNQINGADERSSRIDFLAENSKGELIIQLQNNRETNYMLKMLYGSSKSLIDNFQGYGIGRPKKLISVNIVYTHAQEDDYIYRGKSMFEGFNKKNLVEINKINGFSKSDIKDIFPEFYIIYVFNFRDAIKTRIDEWMYYLKNNEVPDHFSALGLREVKEKLAIDKLSDEEKKKYDSFLNAISNDPVEVLQMKLKTESLLKEKERHTKVEIAKALKSQFVPAEIICSSTGLSLVEIQSL